MKTSSYVIVVSCLLIAAGIFFGSQYLANQTADGKIDNPIVTILINLSEILFVFIALAILMYEHTALKGIKSMFSSLFKNRERAYSLIGKVSLLLFVLVIFFGVLEVSISDNMVVGSFDKTFPMEATRYPFPFVMFKGKPGAMLRDDETKNKNEIVNKNGYRGRIPSEIKDSASYRIFFVGGSTVFNGNPSISSAVEEICHQEGLTHIETYNYGVVSSNTKMDLARLTFEISNFSPDLIVFYGGGNDINLPSNYDPRPGYPFNFVSYENNPYYLNGKYELLPLVLYKSNLIRYFSGSYFVEKFTDLSGVRDSVHYGSEEWSDLIVSEYINNLSKADKIAKAFKSDFVSFFQPLVYYKDSLYSIEKNYNAESVLQHNLNLRKKIRTAPKDFKFYDLSDIFDNSRAQIFIDDIHIAQESTPIIAEAIYSCIKPLL